MEQEPKLKVLSLFAGIGGFELGLERTGGFETVAQCEIDPFCRRVLAKHWPNVKRYEDVRTLTADTLRRDGIAVDVICGGFPCQDISEAGRREGIDGERSGLWSDYARLIGEIRPQFVLVENVSALLGRGIERVLGSLATVGYDAEWHCIPASYVGSPQQRDRIWIVAYPQGSAARIEVAHHGSVEADRRWTVGAPSFGGRIGLCRTTDWDTEPEMGRVVDGVSPFVDEVAALGNAVVPQIPELIGNAILQSRRAA